MTDILKHGADILFTRLLSQQQILDPTHGSFLALVDEMIPRAGVAIQHRRSFDVLSAILTSLTLERVMRVAGGARSVLEKFSQGVQTEMPLDVFGRINHAG